MKHMQTVPFLLLLSCCVFSSQLSVTVTATQDTLLPMTNVSIISNGVTLYAQKTGNDGIARFNLTDGSYFVLLPKTSIYPSYVALVDVKGNTDLKLTKYLCGSACTAHAYGQITGPDSFNETSIVAYSNGLIVKRALPNKDGLYSLSYVPEGNYEIVYESPGFKALRLQAFLPASDFVELNAPLEKETAPPEPKVEIRASSRVQQHSIIEIALSKGGPLIGKEITIQTPSGTISAITNAEGKAHVNAAEPGNYSFFYAEGNISASTTVIGNATHSNGGKQGNTSAIQPPPWVPPAQNKPVSQPSGIFTLGIAAIITVLAFVVAAAVFLAWMFSRKKQAGAKPGEPHKRNRKKS